MATPNPKMGAAVVELCNKHMSFSEVATELGITKNAAAGYCYRARQAGIHVETSGNFRENQIARSASTKARNERRRALAARKRAETLPETKRSTPIVSTRPVFSSAVKATPRQMPLSRHRTCQFIAGEKGRDFKFYSDPGVFCGAPALAGSSCCQKCHTRTHGRFASLG